MTKEEEYFRLQKNITHINRYGNLNKRMSAFIDELQKKEFISDEDKDDWYELVQEQIEALTDMFMDQAEELKGLRIHHGYLSTALRYYINEYGDHLVSEPIPTEPFITTVTITPIDKESTDVKVEIVTIEEFENAS